MMANDRVDFFSQFGQSLVSTNIRKSNHMPFKDHDQFPMFVDVLARKYQHHLFIQTQFSAKMLYPLFEAFVEYLTHTTIPQALRDIELIHLSLPHTNFSLAQLLAIENDFQKYFASLENKQKCVLFVFSDVGLFSELKSIPEGLRRQFELLLSHPKVRVLIFSDREQQLDKNIVSHFFSVNLSYPAQTDILNILKLQRTELESYHHVIISDELLAYAYALAEKYLSTQDVFDKALLLLDSASARAATQETTETVQTFKPVLSTTHLITILSHWTHIPVANLQVHRFKISEFIQGMQERLFGQDEAISALADVIQQTQINLQPGHSILPTFLFTGPQHSGKKSAASAIAAQLYRQTNMLYFAQLDYTLESVLDIKFLPHCENKTDGAILLRDLVLQLPYVILVFENIEQFSRKVLFELNSLAKNGYLQDNTGKRYYFQQSMLILCTTLGSAHLIEASQSMNSEFNPGFNLMQLMLHDQTQAETAQHLPDEMIRNIRQAVGKHLPYALSQTAHIIPFFLLDKSAIGRIITMKLKTLCKLLDADYHIELTYAPEVIRYLANEIAQKQSKGDAQISVNEGMRHLYFIVEQALHQQSERNRANQLFLQLDETGQLLRCDWILMGAIRHI